MLQYIIQTIVFQLLFLLVYELFLKKETFFNYNRIYLLLTPVIALLLPLLKFPFLQSAIPAEALIMLPDVLIGTSSTVAPEVSSNVIITSEAESLNWWLVVYAAGFLFSLGIFVNKFRILKHLFSYKPVLQTEELKIVEIPQSTMACTFYNTIFLGSELSQREREQILSHEKVHVRQKHTIDLLFFEVLKMVFWFNPLVYIYQSRISTLHEFLADAGVVKHVKKQDYFQQLLNSAFDTRDISFINQFFNHSIIKKRIVMLQKSRSKTISKFKFLIILPLMLAMLTYVACSSGKSVSSPPPPPPPSAAPTASVAKTNPSAIAREDLEIPFAVVEQVPIYPGCENFTNQRSQRDCMTQKISDHVNKNFNTSIGKTLGLTGLSRIYVRFKVSSTGKVVDVESRAPHPALGAEAERVVRSLPDMEPAMHEGQKVAILYSLPIVLNTPKPENSEGEEGNQE